MSTAFDRLPAHTMHVRRSRGVGVTLFVVVTSAIFAQLARSTAPRPFALAIMLILLTMFAWAVKPIVGLCATVYFALVSDGVTMPWYPFTKGLSAKESILFISNSLILSPMELVLIFAVLALFGRFLVLGRWELRIGRLPFAVGAFIVFIVYGIAHGYLNGANHQIALFEARPFIGFALVYLLVSSVCSTTRDYRYLLWAVLCAISTHALISLEYLSHRSSEELKATESLLDHGAAMRMDLLILVVISSWMFPGTSRMLRIFATVMIVPVGWVYLVAQRRAAVVGLVGAFALLGVVLFWHRRRAFFRIVPLFALVLTVYVAAFWNSTSSTAFPAQAVKSVISPTDVSDRNQSSDLYRIVENVDLHFTIQTARLQGIGFGNPFFRPFPLPALTQSFEFALYIPHNSFLWIWMTTGFGGFVAMIYLLGRAVSVGAATVRTWTSGTDLVVLLTFVLAVVVFAIFCFVDIAWDAGNLTLLGASIAVCANYPLNRAAPPESENEVAGGDDVEPRQPRLVGAMR
jgi:hypothetical protein